MASPRSVPRPQGCPSSPLRRGPSAEPRPLAAWTRPCSLAGGQLCLCPLPSPPRVHHKAGQFARHPLDPWSRPHVPSPASLAEGSRASLHPSLSPSLWGCHRQSLSSAPRAARADRPACSSSTCRLKVGTPHPRSAETSAAGESVLKGVSKKTKWAEGTGLWGPTGNQAHTQIPRPT